MKHAGSAIDFDKSAWTDDALALLDACDSLEVPAYLERSRSGNGGHIWIFFDRAVPAAQARKLGALLLTRCKQQRYQLSFESYDRMFPNQDTMPKGQFGNLIALPLQQAAAESGNSVFVDRQLRPFDDQWKYLRSIKRIASARLNKIVRDAAQADEIMPVPGVSVDEDVSDPWTIPPSGKPRSQKLDLPLPKSATVTLGNLVYVDKTDFSAPALSRVLSIAAFQNPEFYKFQAMRMSTFGHPRFIACGEDLPKHIALPRGCFDELKTLLETAGVRITLNDERNAGCAIDATFNGKLRPQQQAAVEELLKTDIGVLSAATAFGKTVVASHCIAARGVNTLVLVHRTQLLDQWKDRLQSFLRIDPKSIGQLGAGKNKRTGIVDVATIQSLQRNGVVKDVIAEYGQIIVDECHHIPAFTFEQVLRKAKAKFVLGLTATPVRKDGHHPIVLMQCGPIRFKVGAGEDQSSQIQHHLAIPRTTSFALQAERSVDSIQELYGLLTTDGGRNDLLFNDILYALEQKRSPLVITERTAHLDALAQRLSGFARNIIVFRGGLGKKQRVALKEKLQSIPNDEERVVLATGKYIGEGFDDSRLDTLFLAMPISWKGTLEQYAGRLHREHEGKSVVRIYDYVDASVPQLQKMYERRLRGYKSIGYEVVTESEC
jgi:superfamily II DNA or RNA helicase